MNRRRGLHYNLFANQRSAFAMVLTADIGALVAMAV